MAAVIAARLKASFKIMPDSPFLKIVSLVPSLTELLIYLGLKEQLIGRTRFCIHPEADIKSVPIVGGTKNPNLEKIISLKPDFILANKEENRKEDIEILQKYSRVRVTDISTIEDAILEILALGNLFQVQKKAQAIVSDLQNLLDQKPNLPKKSVAYFIWRDPWMTVGNDTFIHDVLKTYHLQNVYGDQTRYPSTDLTELAGKKPDLILLSSEPYPFKQKHLQEIQEVCPNSQIQLVNGEWFSWHGSRMLKACKWLNSWRKLL